MDTWMKIRGRTPGSRSTTSLGSRTPRMLPTPSFETLLNPFEEEERVENDSRLRASSRVPSILNFGKQTASTAESTSQPSPVFSFKKYPQGARDAESVWYNPNVDQMAEALKVNMMKSGNFQPIPVEYNSHILHVLEAYWQQGRNLQKKDKEIAELKGQLDTQANQFEQLGEEWSTKERQYKVEVKNLEIMVATGVAGLEAVTLNRCKSNLDRSSSLVQERLRQIRSGSGRSEAQGGRIMTGGSNSAKEQQEVSLSKMFSQKKHRGHGRHIRDKFRSYKDSSTAQPEQPQTRHEHNKARRELEKMRYGPDYDSSPSSEDEEDDTNHSPNVGLSSDDESKPLPHLPLLGSADNVHTRGEGNMEDLIGKTDARSESMNAHSRVRSYVPGDDSYDWRQQFGDARASWPTMDSYVPTPSTGSFPSKGRQTTNPSDSHDSFSPPQLRAKNLEQFDANRLKRGDSKNSNSSMVTAIRDKSARGSTDMTRTPAATSNDAIAAAQVATPAAGDNPSPNPRRSNLREELTEHPE